MPSEGEGKGKEARAAISMTALLAMNGAREKERAKLKTVWI